MWTVRPGDTLTGIAAAFGLHGGWQTLYAANRHSIGTNPDLIRPGIVLALPATAGADRYTVAPGDTLSAIAAALAIPGGWQALYAANRRTIGPDPGTINPGTVLATPPAPAAARTQAPATAPPGHQSPGTAQAKPSQAPGTAQPSGAAQAPGTAQASRTVQTGPGRLTAPGNLAPPPAGGMPRWLLDLLIAAGILAATAFAAEPAAALARRRKGAGPDRHAPAASAKRAKPGKPERRPKHHAPSAATDLDAAQAAKAAAKAKIILAEHERLIVTYSIRDHTVYVLTPPGEDPMTVLAAARLVLPEDTYQDLAGHLGVPSAWPFE
jgi:LysM repeat protein